MKIVKNAIFGIIIVMFLFGYAFSQETGDFRSLTTGNWSDIATWETFNGADWIAAGSAPTGTETITVDGLDTVRVDVAVTITGYVMVTDTGSIEITDGSLTFGNGSTYEHARDAGSIPTATWDVGSTFLLTGTVQNSPANRNQDFYHVTFNTPDLGRNRDMGWDGNTIGGDVRVINTGLNRWQMTSASSGDSAEFAIMGDVIVEDGQFAVQGTGNALTKFIVNHYGNINVTGGNFSVARGSQGNGSGTTTWYLYSGNFSMSNATTQNSNSTPGNAKFVFAKNDTQQITFDNVVYGGGDIHFKVSDTTTLQITQDFAANGLLVNKGEIDALGTLTFMDGAVYEHARDAGSIPTATWDVGSTFLLTGTVQDAPANRNQDFYHVTFNTPDLGRNRDMGWDGNTIGGDISVISTGAYRWQMTSASGGDSAEFTIMGDVIVEDGTFATQGTGNALTKFIVHHYGNVVVTGGNFSVARGSQGSGSGSTRWYLHEGNFSMSNATTQNSNATNAWFVFDKDTVQTIELSEVTYGSGGLAIEVAGGTTLDFGVSQLGGNGLFILNEGATLATANEGGIDSTLQTTGKDSLSKGANYTFNGTTAQVPGMLLPDSIGTLTIANPAGVSFNDTLSCMGLDISSGAVMQIDTAGNLTTESGSVNGTVVNKGIFDAVTPLLFEDGSVYEHARNGGGIPSGVWNEGSTLLMTGTVQDAPANRNQDFYHVTFNTPDLGRNRDMGWDGNTIGGDISVISTGAYRWQMTSASGGDSAEFTIMGDVIVEDGTFATQGTGNALTKFIVHHYGNVVVTGGNFSVARGSQGSGSGSTRWYLHEGNFSMSNATTQNSNATNAWFVFDKDTVQTIELSEVTYGSGGLAIEVAGGTTLDFGVSQLGGNGLFILNEGATLATANEGGIDSTLQTTGDDSLHVGANYIFNGSTAQVTGTQMPMTVNGLTIDNEAGVKLSQATLINGVLRLENGVFDNTIPFTLGPNGSIVVVNGSLLIDPTSIEGQSHEIPTEFALFQNFPNPFNPTTTIRYDVKELSEVTVKIYDVLGREVAELVNDQHVAGSYAVTWDARAYASGVYYYRISAGDFVSVRKLVLMK